MNIEIKNKNEILRIYENNEKKAKTDKEKAIWANNIEKEKAEISKLEAAQ